MANPTDIPLTDVIPAEYLKIFVNCGIKDLPDLWREGKEANSRSRLAQETQLRLGDIESWVLQADLLQLNQGRADGITPAEARRLIEVELDGLRGLRRMSREGMTEIARRLAGLEEKPSPGRTKTIEARLKALHAQATDFLSKAGGQGIVTHPHNLLVVSDLHLGRGVEVEAGKVNRNEDFLYDDDFANLLVYQQQKRQAAYGFGTTEDRPWRLVMNGDVVDFLQVTDVPAKNIEELMSKVTALLGMSPFSLAGSGAGGQPALPDDGKAVVTLSHFFDQVNSQRKPLAVLRKWLQGLQKRPDLNPVTVRTLKAEVDILINAGDSRLDTNRLTDLEEMLRIPSELDAMTQILTAKKRCNAVKPFVKEEKKIILERLKSRLAPGAPQKALSETGYDFLQRQILTAWELMASTQFTPDLLELVRDLGTIFDLEAENDPVTASVWIPRHIKGDHSAFARYRDLLVRFRHHESTLGQSINQLQPTGYSEAKLSQKAQAVGEAIRQAFAALFVRVPAWEVGIENPYTLRYEQARWGLGSSKAENVWRVYKIYEGHPTFFQAMAWFIAYGNDIIIQTGNHDIEIFWPEIREAFRDVIKLAYEQLESPEWQSLFAGMVIREARTVLPDVQFEQLDDAGWRSLFARLTIPELQATKAQDQFGSLVKRKVSFTHWLYYEPGVAYIEHGCQYETANSWPTYLDPRYVGTVADHQMRTDKGKIVSGQIEQPQLFWPWGSLIVRYIFNQMEQTHPFADQIKPITNYFAWAFSRDFLRSLGLLILSIPGIGRVLNQILDRGVVEGWFGSTYSVTGLPNMILRGASTWLTWLLRFIQLDWLRSASARRRLRWPVLPWHAWKRIVQNDLARREKLAGLLPDFYWRPRQIEHDVLRFKKLPEPVAVNYWDQFWSKLLELAIQIIVVVFLFGATSWLVGLRFETNFGPMATIGVARGFECRGLALLPTAPPTLLGFLFPVVFILGLLLLPLLFSIRLKIQRFQRLKKEGLLDEKSPGYPFQITTLLTGLAGTLFSIYLLANLYCGFAYFHLPQRGPWAGLTALPTWVVWILLFLIGAIVLRRQADEMYLRQKLRNLSQNWLLRHQLRLRALVSGFIVLLGLAGLFLFGIYYGQPTEAVIEPDWLGLIPWLFLVLWLLLASLWWGTTVLLLFFAGGATVGLMSLTANIFLQNNIVATRINFLWASVAFVASLLVYFIVPPRLPFTLRKSGQLVIKISAVILALAWALSWGQVFRDFYELSDWSGLLPLWIIWGFIGLWILESKENPFNRPQFQGWLKDRLGSDWSWLRSVLDSTLTLIIELGFLMLLLGIAAQIFSLRGQAPPSLLANLVGSRGAVLQVLTVIFLLLVLGIGARAILSSLQTEDFPLRIRERYRTQIWRAHLLLGLAILALFAGSLWLAFGNALLNDLAYGVMASAILAAIGLGGWLLVSRNRRGTVEESRLRDSLRLLGLAWIILFVLGILLVRQLSLPDPLQINLAIRFSWYAATLLILAVLSWLEYAGPRKSPNPGKSPDQFKPRVINAISWGFLLLAGIMITTVLVRGSLNKTFTPLIHQNDALTEQMTRLNEEVEHALFLLRLEQAVRLSFSPFDSEREPSAYLSRLRGEDATTAVYFTQLFQQPRLQQQYQASILEYLSEIEAGNLVVPGGQIETVETALQDQESAHVGLGYAETESLVNNLMAYFENHPTRRTSELSFAASQPEAQMAEQTVQLARLSREWRQLTTAITEGCSPERLTGLPFLPEDTKPEPCEWMAAYAWQSRFLPAEDLSSYTARLSQLAEATNASLAAVTRQVKAIDLIEAPGLWEQLSLILWLRLQSVDNLGFLNDPVEVITGSDLGNTATQLELVSQQRTTQLNTLQALHQFAKQRRTPGLYGHAALLLIILIALVGLGGYLLHSVALRLARTKVEKIDAAKQMRRIGDVAQRQQSGFVRKFTRTATVVLSFSFGAGLIIGAYLVITGLFSGDLFFALRNGASLTLISWIGRRLVLFIPASGSHAGGYLARAAAEIKAVLDRGTPLDKAKAFYSVPYFLFGHDHAAGFKRLNRVRVNEADFTELPQWYVNTGAWVQAYTGEVRFRREDEEYSVFVEIVPGPKTTGLGSTPRLLRWDRTVGRPSRLHHLVQDLPESLLKRMVKTVLRWLGLRQDYTWPRLG